MGPWRPVSGPMFSRKISGCTNFCRAKHPWIFLDHLYMGFSITPFEEWLARGPFCMKWILDGYELMDPKNQQMDPPFLWDLNLFFAGFFLDLQTKNQPVLEFLWCFQHLIYWNPKNFLKKIKQIFFFQPSEPVTTWDPNDCRSWSVGVEQCLCLSCVWVISLGQLFRRPAWLAPNFLVN